jgi:hypothetical protein
MARAIVANCVTPGAISQPKAISMGGIKIDMSLALEEFADEEEEGKPYISPLSGHEPRAAREGGYLSDG